MSDTIEIVGYIEDGFMTVEKRHGWERIFERTRSPEQAIVKIPAIYELDDDVYVVRGMYRKVRITIDTIAEDANDD